MRACPHTHTHTHVAECRLKSWKKSQKMGWTVWAVKVRKTTAWPDPTRPVDCESLKRGCMQLHSFSADYPFKAVLVWISVFSLFLLFLQVKPSIWRETSVTCARQSFQPEPQPSICAGRASRTSSRHGAACCSPPSECFTLATAQLKEHSADFTCQKSFKMCCEALRSFVKSVKIQVAWRRKEQGGRKMDGGLQKMILSCIMGNVGFSIWVRWWSNSLYCINWSSCFRLLFVCQNLKEW